MEVTVPILVLSSKRPGEKTPTYLLQPVFFTSPQTRDYNLGRGTAKLAATLRKTLKQFAESGKHEWFSRYIFCPALEGQRLKLALELRNDHYKATFFVVTLKALGRHIAFLPMLPDTWFEIAAETTLQDRATEVLTRYFRDLERDGDDVAGVLRRASLDGKAWLTTVEFEVETAPKLQKTTKDLLASLFAGESADGATELENTGRNLDRLYPDELTRCVCREDDVAELVRLLQARDRRPVLVLGPRTVGKTALIQEAVFRKVDRQTSRFQNRRNTWLISPQRLISGMSYVGQWENRLLAILKECRKKDHVLYFDDLVGMFRAGVCRDSDLSVAHVLKPVLEQRQVRIVAESTPAAFRVLRELDRSFADFFHVISLQEPAEETSLQVLFSVIRRLERQYRCQFELDVLPTVMDLARRFSREQAFPGQPALMLHALASRNPHKTITRQIVLEDFESQSGLKVAFLDATQRLRREDIIAGIQRMMVGQQPAVEAAADVISIAKARINDPERPWGCFLFLGPTGVGKTQCVKAIANELLGSPDRMVRFDMNEYLSAGDVSRLVGTLDSPEGLLTSAIRRQPYSVVLLDEIEKAHPAVFDLLLQVLGEGRLTDALGRTADFRNAILILTSNLGSQQAENSVGFQPSEVSKEQVYLAAVEKFFRPEFLNRLDFIIPFDRLNETEIQEISRQAVEALGEREGFVRRKCVLHPDDSVLDYVIARGFDPRWGARGVRRMIEKDLMRPVAAELSKTPATGPTVVQLWASDDSIQVEAHSLEEIELHDKTVSQFSPESPEQALGQLRSGLNRVMEDCQTHRPTGPMTSGNIRPEQFHYLTLMEALKQLETQCQRLTEQLGGIAQHQRLTSQGALSGIHYSQRRPGRMHLWRNDDSPSHRILREMLSADDVHDYLNEVSQEAPREDANQDLANCFTRLALFQALAPGNEGWRHERVLLFTRSLQVAPLQRRQITQMLKEAFQFGSNQEDPLADLGLEAEVLNWGAKPKPDEEFPLSPATRELLARVRSDVICYEGLNARQLLAGEVGTHLCVLHSGRLIPFQTALRVVPAEDELEEVIQATLTEHLDWLTKKREHQTEAGDPLFSLQPVVRIYDERGLILDLATGQSLEQANLNTPGLLRELILGRLPLPDPSSLTSH